MKTTKLLSVLSLVMIFAVNVAYSKNGPSRTPDATSKTTIRYEVTIHNLNAFNLCNTYQVQVTDENGRLVAAPTTFVPGINKYTFFEEGPAKGRLRMANLVLSPYTDRIVCPVNFTLRPAVILWPFLGGNTYSLNLYPVLQETTKDGGND
jgi:hypothetical protein